MNIDFQPSSIHSVASEKIFLDFGTLCGTDKSWLSIHAILKFCITLINKIHEPIAEEGLRKHESFPFHPLINPVDIHLHLSISFHVLIWWSHDEVIKWEYFTRYWPFVRGFHWSPVGSPHKGQWCGTLMFSLICAWTNGWANTRDDGAYYDVTVMHDDDYLENICR